MKRRLIWLALGSTALVGAAYLKLIRPYINPRLSKRRDPLALEHFPDVEPPPFWD